LAPLPGRAGGRRILADDGPAMSRESIINALAWVGWAAAIVFIVWKLR
jgi:hypothetical protein